MNFNLKININFYFIISFKLNDKLFFFISINDKICRYEYSSINYVKMCKEGQYCKSISHGLSMCVDIPKQIRKKVLGDACSLDEECEQNLICDNKCTYPSCSNTEKIFKKQNGDYDCKDNDMQDGVYFYQKFDNNFRRTDYKSNPIDYGKVGGIISYIKDNTNQYYITQKEGAFIGTVKEGEFVDNPLACQSGYALPFYFDGTLIDPNTAHGNTPHSKCVVVNEIGFDQEGNCHVNYDDNKIYYFPSGSSGCDETLMTKLKLFKKYTEIFTKEKQESCAANKENYNELETCNDDEIRKWKYFYDHPEHYILYYEKEDEVNDVVNYLIQTEYNEYQSSDFLKLKNLFLLFSLFLI